MIHRQFYRELGKILYAIAYSDGMVQPVEIKKMESIIADEIKTVNLKNHNPEYKEIILVKLSFQNCMTEKLASKKCADSFLFFIRQHGQEIDPHQKQLALNLVSQVSETYKGKSRIEKKLETEVIRLLSV